MGIVPLLFHNQGRGRPIGGGGVTPTPVAGCFTVGTSIVGTNEICVAPYYMKVLNVSQPDLITYWPQNEASGLTADNIEGTAARDGTYTGVTLGQPGIGDGNTCPLYDGANDYTDLYTASLVSAFNGAAGTAACFFKANDWDKTGGIFYLYADSNNYVQMNQGAPNHTVELYYKAGGTFEPVIQSGETLSSSVFYHLAVTWDKAADEFKAYFRGVQIGATQTGLGVWSGNLASTTTLVGAKNTTPTTPIDGYIAHPAIWTKALTPAQILSLATV